MRVRSLKPTDVSEWHALRSTLWPDCLDEDNAADTQTYLNDPARWAVIVCEEGGRIIGFVEAHLREYADGCRTEPVGYIEGWYVVPEHRRSGVGPENVDAAQHLARSKGCTQMASDARLGNAVSHRAHRALGYEEVDRMVSFRKALG